MINISKSVKDSTYKEQEHITIVKESHKCINTPRGGIDTGSFFISDHEITVTGWGLPKKEIISEYDRLYQEFNSNLCIEKKTPRTIFHTIIKELK